MFSKMFLGSSEINVKGILRGVKQTLPECSSGREFKLSGNDRRAKTATRHVSVNWRNMRSNDTGRG
jgi:hypothetical protein